MKKIGFIMLFIALVLTGCQNNWDNIPKQEPTLQARQERLWMIKNPDGSIMTRATAIKNKQWEKGDTIRIKFLPGGSYSITLENYVKQYAAIWLKHANLYFEYVHPTENADVKIGFDLEDRWITWSTIGKDCQAIAQDQPSLNFFALGDYTDEIDIQGDVLRGFGHVLGLVFEHQNPQSPIQFNARAKNSLKGTYNLTEEEVNEILSLYNIDQTNYSQYDPTSIMVLSIPGTLLVDRTLATPNFNTELSDKDITFIKESYRADPIKENLDSLATVNINAINAHIAAQIGNYKLRLGVNHDGGEALPFTATDLINSSWFGYVSHGIVYRKQDTTNSIMYYDGPSTASIFKNELYFAEVTPIKHKLFIYTLNFNMIDSMFSYVYPYIYDNKRFMTSNILTINGKLSLKTYNLDEKKESHFTIDYPSSDMGATILYIKNNFIYFTIADDITRITSLYKMKLGTFDSYTLAGTVNEYINAFDIATNIDGTYYMFSRAWQKAILISPNDEMEVRPINSNEYTIGYMNKLYRTNTTSKSFYYQVEL